MMKIKSFFVGILLLIIVFVMVIFTTLVYRANERSNIRTYIFQMGNSANQRVGELQNIDDMPQNDLRNKLIKKYVSEYFKVIPGDTNVTNRPILKALSAPESDVFEQWEKGEAAVITKMSNKKMFRMVRVNDNGIDFDFKDNSDKPDYRTSDTAEYIYYAVNYDMLTWTQSNNMMTEPQIEHGVMYIEARFKPGIKKYDNHGNKINIRKYLESGQSPVGLFMFEVTHIGSKQ